MNLNKATLSEQIYNILRNDILTRAIGPGEKLTLKSLQERFGVSSTPVRDALTRLSDEGLAVYYSNIGVNVIELSKADLKELYQFMGDLDSLAILYAARHPEQGPVLRRLEENIRQTTVICQQKESPLPRQQVLEWKELSDNFHLIFYDYCDNARLARAAEKQRSQLTIYSNLYETIPPCQSAIEAFHETIYEAYRNGDYELSARRMKLHLEESLTFALQYCLSLHD